MQSHLVGYAQFALDFYCFLEQIHNVLHLLVSCHYLMCLKAPTSIIASSE